MGVSLLPITTTSWVVKPIYLRAFYLVTPIYSFIICYNDSSGSPVQSIMLHISTRPHQHFPSLDLMRDTNLRQPTEICYINHNIDIIVHHITLSKTQKSTQSVTLR